MQGKTNDVLEFEFYSYSTLSYFVNNKKINYTNEINYNYIIR